MTTFYYTKGGEEVFGPVPEDDLRQLREAGVLRATAMVCRAGERTWKPIGEAIGTGEASGRGVTPPPESPTATPPEGLTGSPKPDQAAVEGGRTPASKRNWDRLDRFGALATPVVIVSMCTVCFRRWGEGRLVGFGMSFFAESLGNTLGVLMVSIAVSYLFRRKRRFLVRACVAFLLFVSQWVAIAHDAQRRSGWGWAGEHRLTHYDQGSAVSPVGIVDSFTTSSMQSLRGVTSSVCSVPESIGITQAAIAEIPAEQTALYQLGHIMMRASVEAALASPIHGRR